MEHPHAKEVVNRLFRAVGHLEAVRDMVAAGRDCSEVLIQLAAVRAAVDNAGKLLLRDHLEQTAAEIDDWIANLFTLAQRLDTFESDRTIQTDLKAVPAAIQKDELRLRNTIDPSLKKQIEETLASRRSHLASLQNLQSTLERGRLQMDQTLSSMGTVYSQLLLMDAKDIDSGRYQRLRDDIAEEVKGLHEVVEAMDEVYKRN